jgi:hypothetical protein
MIIFDVGAWRIVLGHIDGIFLKAAATPSM